MKKIPRNYTEANMRLFYASALAWIADNVPGMDRKKMPALKEIEKFKAENEPDWGGHFYPNRHSNFGEIELYPSGIFALDRAIVLHELAHWVRHYTGDKKGVHDDEFFSTTRRLYVRWGVPIEIAKTVETHGYPDSWICENHWCQMSRKAR